MANNRPIAVTKLPRDIPGKIMECEAIKNSITGNSFFATPVPSLTDFGTHIGNLIAAQAELDSGRAGGSAERDLALDKLLLDVSRLVNYVQGIADATPDKAEQIIESAGMFIKGKGGKQIQSYEVTSVESGIVTLTTPLIPKHHPIIWEISSDNGTWTILKVSRVSVCKVDGLISGHLYYFRYYTVDDDNKNTPYSEITSCRVK
jgi:hypothetical protein